MNESRRCTATSKGSGERCRKAAILGGTVCRSHGGAAGQVKRKAAQRLLDIVDPDRALREAARLAYSDITELLDGEGRLKPIAEWPEDLRAAVSSFEVTKRNGVVGDDEQEEVLKVHLWDKLKALELLAKHLGLLVNRLHVTGDWDRLAARLASARQQPQGSPEGAVDAEVVAPALPDPKQIPDQTAPDLFARETDEGDAPEQMTTSASYSEGGDARGSDTLETPPREPPRRRELFTGRGRRDWSWMADF